VVSAGRDIKVKATQTRDVTSVVVGFGGGVVGSRLDCRRQHR